MQPAAHESKSAIVAGVSHSNEPVGIPRSGKRIGQQQKQDTPRAHDPP